MKIRQKIAMLLAAAMTLTAVPMVTMAKSDFSVVSGIKIAEKDDPTSNALKVEMKDATDQAFTFFVNIANAEFPADATDVALAASAITDVTATGSLAVKYSTVKDGKEMKVVVTPSATVSSKGTFVLPLNVKLKGGDATVAVDAAGSVVSDMSAVVFAKTSEKKATVTVGDAKTIYADTTEVAKITLEEPFVNILSKNGKKVKFTIKHSDYEFATTAGGAIDATVGYEKGFTAAANAGSFDIATGSEFDRDKGILEFTPSAALATGTAPGRLTFVFKLHPTDKKPSTGDLNIKVSGDNVTEATVKVGAVKEYGTLIEMKDKKVLDVTAGGTQDTTFTIKEAVAKTFVANRDFDVEFTNGYLSPIKDPSSAQKNLIIADIQTVLNKNISKSGDDANATVTDLIKDSDSYVTGFTAKITKINELVDPVEMKVEDLKVYVPLNYSGDITVKASGRALGYDASTTAINAKKAIEVTSEPMTVKVGLKEQEGGKIVIKEADKAIFDQGEFITIKIDDANGSKGLELKDEDFDKNDKIKVTEGDLVLDLGAAEVKNGVLSIKVKRESTVASTITINNLKVYTDRTLPQGNFDATIGGRALAADWVISEDANLQTGITTNVQSKAGQYQGKSQVASKNIETVKGISVAKFVVVGTPNTEDITSNGLKKGTASFVVGSAKYVVNGVEVTADAAAYAQNGRTMVPVRFVANALGVDGKDIYAAGKAVTIIAGSKTVTLEVGSKVAKLNGAPARTMAVAPVVKNGRVFVPVAEIGALLGVDATWDAATQTATFTNK